MARGSASSVLLVCLLLLAQWTGFSMVLCVGVEHVELERFNAPCCGPHPAHGGMYGDEGGCAGCTDIDAGSAYASAAHDGGYAVAAERAGFRPVCRETAARSLETTSHSRVVTAASPLRC